MFEEVMQDLGEAFQDIGTSKTVLYIAKPFCLPARGIIEPLFRKYGVKLYDIKEKTLMISPLDFARRMKVELRRWENLRYGPAALMWLPMALHATVTVKTSQARWAEYLMIRTGKLYVPGKYFDRRNQAWAEKHGGVLPPAWGDKKPWIETKCKEGVEKWSYLKKHIKR